MSVRSSTSAWWKAAQNSSHSAWVRVKRWGWKSTTVRRSPARRRSASRVARISVGWWP